MAGRCHCARQLLTVGPRLLLLSFVSVDDWDRGATGTNDDDEADHGYRVAVDYGPREDSEETAERDEDPRDKQATRHEGGIAHPDNLDARTSDCPQPPLASPP